MDKKLFPFKVVLRIILVSLVVVSVLSVIATVPDSPTNIVIQGRDADFNAELEQLMKDTEAADRAVVDEAIAEIERYFDDMERNLEPFLDDLYSLSSKIKMAWYLVKDIRFKPSEEFESGLFASVMLLPIKPVREGTHLPDFIEDLFNRYFGGRTEVSEMLKRITGNVSRELVFNNERLANVIGALAVSDDGDKLEQIADEAGDRGDFHDRAGALAMTIANRTSGIQLGSEVFGIFVADSIAAYVISYLVAEGVIVMEGITQGLATFGVATVIALAVDVVANKLAKDNLRPRIAEALQNRRRETTSAFRKQLRHALRTYQINRRYRVRQLLAG